MSHLPHPGGSDHLHKGIECQAQVAPQVFAYSRQEGKPSPMSVQSLGVAEYDAWILYPDVVPSHSSAGRNLSDLPLNLALGSDGWQRIRLINRLEAPSAPVVISLREQSTFSLQPTRSLALYPSVELAKITFSYCSEQ